MKILIAYDGSKCADAALDDLQRAGLPPAGEAVIVSVAEVWLPPPTIEPEDGRDETDDFIEGILQTHRQKGETLMEQATARADEASQRVRNLLPGWSVETSVSYGSPSWEILSRAGSERPDLIVVGSQGHSALSRFLLGSVSQKVLTEAECSVRIARGRVEVDPTPVRLVIGVDGSAGGMAAVRSAASRNWPADTSVKLMAATDGMRAQTGDGPADDKWVERFLSDASAELTAKGLDVDASTASGNPNNVLVEEAERWHADCIFVGANAAARSRLEQFLLGSTAAAVAARAHCSVEVVREPVS
jgi:nucleotide-binding universal stress UspA family protein